MFKNQIDDWNETFFSTYNFSFSVITHDIVIVSKEPALIKCDLQNLDKDQVQDFYWTKNQTILTKRPEIKGRYNVHKDNYTLEIPKASK